MACKRLYFLHCRVFPQNYLIETVPVGRNNLVRRLRKHQIANLGACVDRMQRLQSVRVPETNVSIGSTPTCS